MDVKSSFLSGILEEEFYIEQPEGFFWWKQQGYGLKTAQSTLWFETSAKSLVWETSQI